MNKAMNSSEIRQKFLAFFNRHGHTIVQSSSLIPAEDPTLLFTNAGMNQFKDAFLGKEKRSYTRATSAQKCVRAGGKHNDLDAVGFTERHLTFFEMLGNFSFGDYFKKEAITYAWEFLTKDMHLPADKLHASVYKNDDEAYDLWHKLIGLPTDRIVRLGEKDNFWQMGDTGPCGPCSEIYLDRGSNRGCQQPTCTPGCDCSRFIEIWNLVFMQFDRQPNGELKPLAAKGVDTGMGLERLCMVVQAKETVYDTDLFATIINSIQQLTGKQYATADNNTKAAFRVLSDHIRSSSLLIADGCTPSNEGRGYVLRKIIRRAALFAQKLSSDNTLFAQLAETLIAQLGPIYPELITSKPLIINLLTSEIERFATNLSQGQHILDTYLKHNKKEGIATLSGEQIFKLYDTYGFPPELTRVIAQEQAMSLDMDGFEHEMKKQQEQSGKKIKTTDQELIIAQNLSTKFVGYQTTSNTSTVSFVNYINDHVWIITAESPFYVESGGQVNDTGSVIINNVTYPVIDLKKVGDTFAPAIAVKLACPAPAPTEKIKIGDSAHSIVDANIRANTVKNHTATHMLQAALLQVLGAQIKQAGSLVCDSYLRFDYNHHEALSKEQIESIENIINQKIMENIPTNIFTTTLENAKGKGVISFFGEKYNPENVRVVQIPGFSAELCGGTHAPATGIIGAFKIISDTSLSSGTRRIFAITGPEALRVFQQSFNIVKKLGEEFKVKSEEVVEAIEKLQQQYQAAQTTIKHLKKQLLKTHLPAWQQQMQLVNNMPFLFLELEDTSTDEFKQIAQELEKTNPGFYFMMSNDGQRYSFMGYLAKDFTSKVNLKKVAQLLQDSYNWRGGGSTNIIQGSGNNKPEALDQKLRQIISN